MDGTTDPKAYKIAILWRGDRDARRSATPENNRFHRVFAELAALDIRAEPAVYDEDLFPLTPCQSFGNNRAGETGTNNEIVKHISPLRRNELMSQDRTLLRALN